mmetsp:Transcript_37594/g.60181  ORF Transcript_37594/g.60181 Transcript_37594/m.60181 type:complete len:217 (-) Transcript_37594:310-960(-)
MHKFSNLSEQQLGGLLPIIDRHSSGSNRRVALIDKVQEITASVFHYDKDVDRVLEYLQQTDHCPRFRSSVVQSVQQTNFIVDVLLTVIHPFIGLMVNSNSIGGKHFVGDLDHHLGVELFGVCSPNLALQCHRYSINRLISVLVQSLRERVGAAFLIIAGVVVIVVGWELVLVLDEFGGRVTDFHFVLRLRIVFCFSVLMTECHTFIIAESVSGIQR